MHRLTWVMLCTIISFTSAKKLIVVSPQIIERVQPIAQQCIKESESSPNSLKDMLEWNSQDNLASKKFLHCFCSKAGYIDGALNINNDKFLGLIPDNMDGQLKEDFVNMLNECNKITGEDVYEKLYQMGVCFHQKSPFSFTI